MKALLSSLLLFVSLCRAGEIQTPSKDPESVFSFKCVVKFGKSMSKRSAIQKCSELLDELKKNEIGFTPFSASQVRSLPKLRKGMKKSEILDSFGKPESVSDDGKMFFYDHHKLCEFDRDCAIGFNLNGVSMWLRVKFEFTDNLED